LLSLIFSQSGHEDPHPILDADETADHTAIPSSPPSSSSVMQKEEEEVTGISSRNLKLIVDQNEQSYDQDLGFIAASSSPAMFSSPAGQHHSPSSFAHFSCRR
jgi:hypothetical protein